MKNIFSIILISTLILTACKKNRVCKCTTTTLGTTSTRTVSQFADIDTTVVTPLNMSSDNEVTFYKVSKNKAKSNCFNKSESVNETTKNGIPGIFDLTITNKGTKDYTCKLE